MQTSLPKQELDKWKEWFFASVEREIFHAHNLSIIDAFTEPGQLPDIIMRLSAFNIDLKKEGRKYAVFLKNFRMICKKAGFDCATPIQFDENHMILEHDEDIPIGTLDLEFTKDCFRFFHNQKKAAENKILNMMRMKNASLPKSKKNRFPIGPARCIFFYLEKHKNQTDHLRLLRNYFCSDQFETDKSTLFLNIENQFAKVAALYSHTKKVPKKININNYTIRCINGLNERRGNEDTGKWASTWKNDLLRIILAEKMKKIPKAIGPTESSRVRKSILKEGDSVLKKGAKSYFLKEK